MGAARELVHGLPACLTKGQSSRAWEKDRLCCHARDSANPWAQSFLRIYMRFMETEDVAGFLAEVAAQAFRLKWLKRLGPATLYCSTTSFDKPQMAFRPQSDKVSTVLRLALLAALCDRSFAGSLAPSASTGPVVASSFSPPDLSEPTELDLLDLDEDRELPSMPQEQDGFPEFMCQKHPVLAGLKEFLAGLKEPGDDVVSRETSLITGEQAWAFLAFAVGYAIVQYILAGGKARDLTKEE
eukprot:g17291.t1